MTLNKFRQTSACSFPLSTSNYILTVLRAESLHYLYMYQYFKNYNFIILSISFEKVRYCPKLILSSLNNVCGPKGVEMNHRRDLPTSYNNIFYLKLLFLYVMYVEFDNHPILRQYSNVVLHSG